MSGEYLLGNQPSSPGSAHETVYQRDAMGDLELIIRRVNPATNGRERE